MLEFLKAGFIWGEKIVAIFNKTKIFAGLLVGVSLCATGCMPGHEFTQANSENDISVDIAAAAQSASTGAGAASVPAGPPPPPP